ncbi:hypothetical protein FDP41_001280 [Naegleria fowleri]|uniref:Uncharacterized protein n=1 Tax=Naegleria fowleri TaxID=5763 RepID=A0A6A5BYA3_NAEFO|nr:uncharacterized protein FDP41_001280 [Naegleria fowleri]KAF0979612.1 hypothetical protein FDP41_001280 [Naegleria fowleri]CAG4714549.1 unnamed protein product [Naegleria fowleri]
MPVEAGWFYDNYYEKKAVPTNKVSEEKDHHEQYPLINEKELIEREERRRRYTKGKYEILKADAEVALKLQEDLLFQFYEEDMRMNYIQSRREEIRAKLKEKQAQREQLERSLTIDIPNHAQREKLNKLKDREHLTKSLNVFSNPESTEFNPGASKRSTMNPNYDEAYYSYIENNKEHLLAKHLHRDRDRQFHALQKSIRTTLEEDIGTPFIKNKKRQEQLRQKIQDMKDKQKHGIIAPNHEVEEALQLMDRFEAGYHSD